MGSRRIALSFLGAAMAVVLVFACADESPIVVVDPDSSVTLNEASTDDAAIPATDAGDAAAPVDAAEDPDAAIERGDAGGQVDAAGCQTCDCDRDGFNRPGCGDDAGMDCNDNDTRYKPFQRFLEVIPDEGGTADWNCAAGIEKRYNFNVSCALVSLGNCDAAEGFTGDPACGKEGDYIKCQTVLLGIALCVQRSPLEKRIQACR